MHTLGKKPPIPTWVTILEFFPATLHQLRYVILYRLVLIIMAASNSASQRPEVMDLFTALSGLSWEKMKKVLLHMGVPSRKLNSIEKKHPTSDGARKMDALECWLKRDASASWQKLLGALRAYKLDVLCQIIATQYLGVKPISFTGGALTKPAPVSSCATSAHCRRNPTVLVAIANVIFLLQCLTLLTNLLWFSCGN